MKPEDLGPEDAAEFARLSDEYSKRAKAKDFDGAMEIHQQRLFLLRPEMRQEHEDYVKRREEFTRRTLQPMQFFHGTNADIRKGDMVRPAKDLGRSGNFRGYGSEGHAFATNDSGSAANYASKVSLSYGGPERVYRVEPTGEYEEDPMDSAPGSYRSSQPWKVVGRVPRKNWFKN